MNAAKRPRLDNKKEDNAQKRKSVLTNLTQQLCLNQIEFMSAETLSIFQQAVNRRQWQLHDRDICDRLYDALPPPHLQPSFASMTYSMQHFQRIKCPWDNEHMYSQKYLQLHISFGPDAFRVQLMFSRLISRVGLKLYHLVRDEHQPPNTLPIYSASYDQPVMASEAHHHDPDELRRHYQCVHGTYWVPHALSRDTWDTRVDLHHFVDWLACGQVPPEQCPVNGYAFADSSLVTPVMLIYTLLKQQGH